MYFSVRSYPLIYLLMLFSHFVYCIFYPISITLDFFLLIFIKFLLAHTSLISIIFSNFGISCPTTLVSSAKTWGEIPSCCKISLVRSLVNILKSRHETPHPCPSPLPISISLFYVGITRLLNISYTPCMTSSAISICLIFSKRIS